MNNYQIILGKTYYNKGYFNVGIAASYSLGLNGESITLVSENQQNLLFKINRTANKNGSVRIYGGKELIVFFQNNYKLFDVLKFQLINPNQINFL